jgi:hypothetical protein
MSMSVASIFTVSASPMPPTVRPSPWMSRMRSIASVPSPVQPVVRSTIPATVSTGLVKRAVTFSGSSPPRERAYCSSGASQVHSPFSRTISAPGTQPEVSS